MQISQSVKLFTRICNTDQQKPALSESDFCVNCATLLTTVNDSFLSASLKLILHAAQIIPGTPASALSNPGPPARTLWAPPSPRGPTVNWKGDPGTC